MIALFVILLSLFVILLIPSLIVIFWKKRPVWAFLLGAIIAILTVVAPEMIQTFQAMKIYGSGDPQLMAGAISEALTRGMILTPIILPMLALIQWISRRRYKRWQDAQPPTDIFN